MSESKAKAYKKFTLFAAIGLFLFGMIFGIETTRIKDKRLNILLQAYRYILDDWYEGIELDEAINPDLIKEFIDSIVDDRNTHYTSTIGTVDDSYSAGFGFSFRYYNQYPQIKSLQPHSPIAKATSGDIKIEAGDYIVEVNDNSTWDQENHRQYTGSLRNYFKSTTNPNEIDKFKIVKVDDFDAATGSFAESYDFMIKAGRYEVETADSEILKTADDEDVGLLKISSFEQNTPGKVKEHLNGMKNSNIKKLIIDLRDNPGGFIDSIVEIADYFLPKGKTIAIFEYKDGSKSYYKSQNNPIFNFDQIFIMTNRNSASASEMLTGALVDNGMAIQAGEKTYGKGSAQKTIRLGIDQGQLTYTYAVWTTVGREAIHKVGIEPNIEHRIPASFSYLPFPDYAESYCNCGSIKNILENLEAYFLDKGIEVSIDFEKTFVGENLAVLNEFKNSEKLDQDGIYDFKTFIKMSNARIENYDKMDKAVVDHCLGYM